LCRPPAPPPLFPYTTLFRSWILDNELAASLARNPPADRAALQRQLEATPKAPRNLGDAIWAALQAPLPDEAEAPEVRSGERDKALLRSLQDEVSTLAAEHGLPEGVLASKRRLQALLDRRARGDARWPGALAGWRRRLLEPRLAPLLPEGKPLAARKSAPYNARIHVGR